MATATTTNSRRSARRRFSPAPTATGSRRRRKWPIATAAVLMLVGWFAPAIVANTSLLDWALNRAAADLNGRITTQGASLGWFSPPSITGIEIVDEQNRPLAEIPQISGDRSLASILWDFPQCGRIRLEKPQLHVVLNEDGQSNWEEALAGYLAPRRQRSGPIDLDVEIIGGTVSISTPQAQRSGKIEGFQLAFRLPADVAQPLELKTSGTIGQPPTPGQFTIELTLHRAVTDAGPPGAVESSISPAADQPPAAGSPSNQLTIQAEDLPLGMFEALAGRFLPGAELSGRISSTIRCRFDSFGSLGPVVVEGDLSARDLVLAAEALGTDRVRLERIDASGKIAWQQGRIEIEGFQATSEIGNIKAAGTLALGPGSMRDSLASLLYQNYHLEGEIDLARLAGMLPEVLRIQEATQILSGDAQVVLDSRQQTDGRSWKGRIEVAKLTATSRTKAFAWKQPILVTVDAEEGPQGPVINSLECESDFLQLTAAGTPEDFRAQAQLDLNRLTDRLGHFVDLGGLRLAGDGRLHLTWKRTAELDFRSQAELDIENLQVAIPDRPAWTEKSLKMALSASGRTDFTADSRLDKATLEAETGSDWLAIQLAKPVGGFRRGEPWPITVEINGDLAPWLAGGRPWTRPNDWELGGSYSLQAAVAVSADSIQLSQAELTLGELQVRGPRLNLHESEVKLTVAAGQWDPARRQLELQSAALTGPSLSIKADKIAIGMPRGAPVEVAASATYQGDLGRIQRWLPVDSTAPPSWRLVGRISGQADVVPSAGVTTIHLETLIRNFVATHPSGQRIQDEQIRLAAQGSYHPATQTLEFRQIELQSQIARGQVAGRYTFGPDQADLQLTARIDYDLEQISRLVPPYLGRGIYFGGQQTATISYRGPLELAAAEASVTLPWEWADIHGFHVGPGNLQATLSAGTLQVGPSTLDVSEGKVQLAFQGRLDTDPMELLLPPGPVAQRVRINPRMCADALQYIAPVLAGVTSAEGRFSVESEGGRIPWTGWADGEVAGRLTVDGIRVGPGPLVRELAVVLGYESPVEIAAESVIPFRLVDGRVYHRDLELTFPDLTIRTYGSVGITRDDQSLALIAEMPIPPKWLGQHAAVDSALRNQIVRLPIGGTLERPRIDRRELDRLNRRFIEKAAYHLIEDEVSQGLQKLFGPQP